MGRDVMLLGSVRARLERFAPYPDDAFEISMRCAAPVAAHNEWPAQDRRYTLVLVTMDRQNASGTIVDSMIGRGAYSGTSIFPTATATTRSSAGTT